MRVLYVNHTGIVSGAEHSLLELLEELPAEVVPLLACPDGDLVVAAERLGVAVTTIPELELSFRHGVLRTPRGLAAMARGGIAVQRACRRARGDLIHANSVRAGLIASTPSLPVIPPLIVHVRDALPDTRAARLTRRMIETRAALVLANSGDTASRFAPGRRRVAIRTVYNSVDAAVFDPSRFDRGEARSRLGLAHDLFVLGVIAQITPWKAQDDAIRILGELRGLGVEAKLLIVGEPRFARGSETYDNRRFAASLRTLVQELALDECVQFLGQRNDVPQLLRAMDVLLVPSWHEPFGRSVIEGMAMEVPVIATSAGGPAEIIEDGVDGILLPPRRPELWARAAVDLRSTDVRRAEIGHAARRAVLERFTRKTYVHGVLAAYRDVLGARVGR
jgi:glycosyltransferase involved in cell wall biosynthesis